MITSPSTNVTGSNRVSNLKSSPLCKINQQSSHVFLVLKVSFEYRRSIENMNMSGRQTTAAMWISGARDGGSMKLEVSPTGGGINGTGARDVIILKEVLVAEYQSLQEHNAIFS